MNPPSPSALPFERVAIVGLGLVGGSLARALRGVPEPPEIRATSRDEADLRAARAEGVVDEVAPTAEAILPGADLVVYATPLHPTLRLLGEHVEHLERETVLTDVVGLKAPVLQRVEELGLTDRYVGAHPMAGSEGSGYGEADADLFRNARVWMVHGGAPEEVRRQVQAVWEGVGGAPRWTDAAEHDRSVIWCSHLPQILANALAGALDSQGFTPDDLGPGGRDMTRLAGSPPDLWKDLFAASAPGLGPAVTSVHRALEVVADLLQKRDLHTLGEFMETTRRWRLESGGAGALLEGLDAKPSDGPAEDGT